MKTGAKQTRCFTLSCMPQKMKTNELNYNQIILFYKCTMVASKMAALRLKLLYLHFDSTQKGCVLGFMVQ